MSFTSSLIILSLLTLVIYAQKFDDYFEFDGGETAITNQPLKPENSSTQKTPSQTSTILTTTPSTNQEPTTSTTTTSTPSKTTTTKSSPSEEPKTTTNTNFSIRIQPSIYLLLEELVNKSFEKLEKKFDRLINIMMASKPESSTPEEKKPAEKMEEKTATTEEDKINRLAEENVFDDPFFRDNTDEKLTEKKNIKREKENFEQLLMISIGSAACGTTILLMVILFLHLHNKKQNVKKEVEDPVEPVYNGPPRAEPEDDIPYADDEEIELNSI